MERLPRDIASERRHGDIVRLLDEHVPHSPQMMGVMQSSGSSSLIGKYPANGGECLILLELSIRGGQTKEMNILNSMRKMTHFVAKNTFGCFSLNICLRNGCFLYFMKTRSSYLLV